MSIPGGSPSPSTLANETYPSMRLHTSDAVCALNGGVGGGVSGSVCEEGEEDGEEEAFEEDGEFDEDWEVGEVGDFEEWRDWAWE